MVTTFNDMEAIPRKSVEQSELEALTPYLHDVAKAVAALREKLYSKLSGPEDSEPIEKAIAQLSDLHSQIEREGRTGASLTLEPSEIRDVIQVMRSF